jgi:hypothetical protein
MKKIVLFLFLTASLPMSSVLLSEMQIVDIYVCDSNREMANMTAKALVSRQELLSVSYCKCDGVDFSLKVNVKRMKCKPHQNRIYSCVCVGRTDY